MSIKNIHMPTKKASKNGRGKQIILQLSLEKNWSGRFPPPQLKKVGGGGERKGRDIKDQTIKLNISFQVHIEHLQK